MSRTITCTGCGERKPVYANGMCNGCWQRVRLEKRRKSCALCGEPCSHAATICIKCHNRSRESRVRPDLSWHDGALCSTDPYRRDWNPRRSAQSPGMTTEQKALVCAECPIRAQCHQQGKRDMFAEEVYGGKLIHHPKSGGEAMAAARKAELERVTEVVAADDPKVIAEALNYSSPKKLRRALANQGRPELASALIRPAKPVGTLAELDAEALKAGWLAAIRAGDDREALRLAKLRAKPLRVA